MAFLLDDVIEKTLELLIEYLRKGGIYVSNEYEKGDSSVNIDGWINLEGAKKYIKDNIVKEKKK